VGLEFIIVKSTNPDEAKEVAETFSDATKIPLEISPEYLVKS